MGKLLGIAINRLNKFYAPALHKAAPKVELSGQDRIYVNMGGEITTAAPTGIAGTDVERVQLLQEPVAEPFTSKFEKDSTEAQTEEKNSQEQYEEFMAESSASRADKVKEITGLNDSKATLESSVTATKAELQSAEASAAAASKVLASLHQMRLVGSKFRHAQGGARR